MRTIMMTNIRRRQTTITMLILNIGHRRGVDRWPCHECLKFKDKLLTQLVKRFGLLMLKILDL